MSDGTIDLDGGAVDEQEQLKPDTQHLIPKDLDGVPYCPLHHCRMLATSSGKKGSRKTYYACQVEGCSETGTKIRSGEKAVPNRPQICPSCTAKGDEVACERDRRGSNAARVVLKCPVCGWHTSPMATPQLAALGEQRRRRTAGPDKIGER